jgi:quercetin dioxygenase-like cupin family protein
MASPKIQMNSIDGVWIRQMLFVNVGDIMEGHYHTHNHTTLLSKGSLRVTVNGMESVFTAPQMIFIHKNNKHQLEALEAGTLAYCIHAIRDKDTGDIIEGLEFPNGSKIESLTQFR